MIYKTFSKNVKVILNIRKFIFKLLNTCGVMSIKGIFIFITWNSIIKYFISFYKKKN